MIYRPGKTNIADALSRLNFKTQRDIREIHDYVRAVVETSVPAALSTREIEIPSATDAEISAVKDCVRTGNWENCPIPAYLHMKDELCVYGDILLCGTRIIIPRILREKVTKLAHEGHQGIVKTKARLRTKVWWPKIDKMQRTYVKYVTFAKSPENSVFQSQCLMHFPTSAWQDCSADLLGPLSSGENLLVVVDYYSRYFEVVIMHSTTSTKIIKAISTIFAKFGVSNSLRTDNGLQFTSEEFATFLAEYGVECQTTPRWPQANGKVERQSCMLLKALRIVQVEGKSWEAIIKRF